MGEHMLNKMSWCYGLVREKEGLRISEVYWERKKPFMRVNVFRDNKTLLHWWWAISDIPMIIKDVISQLRHYHIINYEDIENETKSNI